MKRILTYIIYSLSAALLVMSCSENLGLEETNDNVLSFEAQCTDLQTKAPLTEGEDAYKENTISTIDWFFFSDEEGTKLLHQEHSDGTTLQLQVINDNGTYTEYKDLEHKFYLYAVANITLPTEPEGGWTLEALKAINVSTNFTKTVTGDDGKDALALDKDNLNFIMDTYDSETQKYLMLVEPTAQNDTREITVNLSRLAVKISTKVQIAKTVTTTDSFGNTEQWTPVLSETDFDVYMVNALNAGYLSGEPVRRAALTDDDVITKDNYFSYGRNVIGSVEDVTTEDDEYYVWETVDPFYTYPQKWNGEDNAEPYLKVIFPWMSDVKGSAEFHYKIVLPEPKEGVFTLDRNCWYQVTATIKVLGGTENDYVLVDDVYYSVADWSEPANASGTGVSKPVYFLVPKTEFHIYSTEEFDIPFYSDADVEAYFTSISYYNYSGDASALVKKTYTESSRTTSATNVDDYAYTLSVDNTEKTVTFSHEMTDIYVLREIHLIIRKSTSKYAEVTIYQHPAIELKKATDEDGNLIAGDLFVNGRFASVKGATFGEENRGYMHSHNGWQIITGNSYGIEQNTDGTNGYGCLVHQEDIDWVAKPFFITDITVSAFSESNNHYSMKVNLGATETHSYKIGDPRVKASSIFNSSASYPFNETWSLHPYLTGETRNGRRYVNNTSDWTHPGDILVASNDDETRSMIAPHILISSGATEGYVHHAPTEYIPYAKRAATYQEAGFPAGRWRLPTEAEIAFIAARQYDGTIPNIFNRDMTYFASSGRFVVIPNDKSKGLMYFSIDQLDEPATQCAYEDWYGNRVYYTEDDGVTYADCIDAKFVYDVWYWGYDTKPANVYFPNGHENK